MAKGARIGYWRGKIDGVLEDIQALKPTFFIGVPRVFDRVYNGVLEQVAKSNIIRQTVFKYAVQYKAYYMKLGYRHDQVEPFGLTHFLKVMSYMSHFLRLRSCSILKFFSVDCFAVSYNSPHFGVYSYMSKLFINLCDSCLFS